VQIDPACQADEHGPFEDVAPAAAQLEAMGVAVILGQPVVADPPATLYVTNSRQGLEFARAAGMLPILLMHDPEESMKLTKLEPAGGIVSLLELPDFIRFVHARTVVHS
jgi:hypothetical protein